MPTPHCPDNKIKRIKLRLDNIKNVVYPTYPITTGVPFADKELTYDAAIRIVTENGIALPAQTSVTATWDKDKKFVKWLLVDFQAEIRSESQNIFYLEYGLGIVNPTPEIAIKITEKDATRFSIHTGTMCVDIQRESFDFLSSCRMKNDNSWSEILRCGGPWLYMSDQSGTRYDTRDFPTESVTIEEHGPLRVVVCVRGHHSAEDGRLFCPYVLRMHFYAGRSDIRIFHTFIYDQVPELVELADIGMCWPINTGEKMRTAFSAHPFSIQPDNFKQAKLLQLTDQSYNTQCNGMELASGEKADGWATLSGENGAVLAVVRDFWKEYPKGIVINSENGQMIDMQIWPSDSPETLKFSTPYKSILRFDTDTRNRIVKEHDEAAFKKAVNSDHEAIICLGNFGLDPLTKEEFEWVEYLMDKYAPNRYATYNDPGTHSGYGAAKTTEMLLHFSGSPISNDDSQTIARSIQEPLIPVIDPNHMSATLALRPFAAVDAIRFPDASNWMNKLFERVVAEPKRKLRVYGMINYGDRPSPHAVAPSNMWIYFKDHSDVAKWMKHCSIATNMEANDQLLSMWGFFLNSGKTEHFLEAEAYGEHYSDVDCYHIGHSKGWSHRHGADHWSGGPEPSHSCITGLMLQYYLTGNQRLFDICHEAAKCVLNKQEPCGIYSLRRMNITREFTGPVNTLLQFYQATWNPKYGKMAKRSIKWLCLTMDEPGKWPFKVATGGSDGDEATIIEGWLLRHPGGMVPQLLYDAVQVFGDETPIFKACLLGLAQKYIWGEGPMQDVAFKLGDAGVKRQDCMNNHSLIAYAYELSGNPVYAAWCEYYMREIFPKSAQRETEQPHLRHVTVFKRKGEKTVFENLGDGESHGSIFNSTWWAFLVPPMAWAVIEAEKKLGVDGLRCVQEDWIDKVTTNLSGKNTQVKTTAEMLAGKTTSSLGVIQGYK